MTTTPLKVRKALLKEFGTDPRDGKPLITFFRSPAGYYYFSGIQGVDIASIYSYSLDTYTTEEIVQYVRDQKGN